MIESGLQASNLFATSGALREIAFVEIDVFVILQPFGCFLGNSGSFFVVRYSRNASTTGFVP